MNINRLILILLLLTISFALSSALFAMPGAGPDDIYGGPSQNNNICTPYHFIPVENENISYEYKSGPNLESTEPQNVAYWTQANNISQSISSRGTYWAGFGSAGWQQSALAIIYPKGSAYKMNRSHCLFEDAIGEMNGKAPKDTIHSRAIGSGPINGRIPIDLGYREDLDPYSEKYMDRTQRLHVSTRPEDLEVWPDEFRNENGNPVTIGDEDVVLIHWNRGPWDVGLRYMSTKFAQIDAPAATFMEHRDRVISFSASIARDILFFDLTLINKSQYHPFPDIGPFDIEEYMYGPGALFTMGDQTGGQRVAFVPKYDFGFTFEETFSDPAIDGATPMGGIAVIKACETRDHETGELVTGELKSFTTDVSGGAWGYYVEGTNPGQSLGYNRTWNTRMGDEKFLYLQDPGIGNDPESELPLISLQTSDRINFTYHSDNPICPGDSLNFVYAVVCAFPSVGDPASMATSPEGLAVVASGLIQNAAMARSLYESNYAMPRAPQSPNVRIIPGDHQVTVTWDNVSEYSRDGFYDQYAGQGTDYREFDFEGYRIYRSTTGEANDAQLVAQFDIKNGIVLNSGIKNIDVDVVDAEGNKIGTGQTNTYTDTLGIAEHDPSTGARYGLGIDNGLRYSYIDKYEERVAYGAQATNQHRLTNGFRYFYAVTAYDWNGVDKNDLGTMFSLESSLNFGKDNMVIPGSNPSSYKTALIDDELTKIQMLSSSGNVLDTEFRDIWVSPVGDGSGAMVITEGSVPSNSLSDPFIYIVNPELITADAEYYIQIDSIIGAPNNLDNPVLNADYDNKLMSNIFVSLKDEAGNVLSTDDALVMSENGAFAGYGAHFFLHPEPVTSYGVPFNIEFDIPTWNTNYLIANDMVVESGSTPAADIQVLDGYNNGNSFVPIGYRAADYQINWVDTGDDSLTVEIWDRTHNVAVPYRRHPGSGWSFVGSWGRYIRLAGDMRENVTESDYDKAGAFAKAAKIPSRGTSVGFSLYISGAQVKVSTDQTTVPQSGDVWMLRTAYGSLPADTLGGYLVQIDADGNSLKRPPAAGVKYQVSVTNDTNESEDADLNKIRVVPNPYIVADVWDKSPQEKRIAFTNLPNRCSVRIYTLGGNLVQVLAHEGTVGEYAHFWKGGTEFWNLKNRYNMLVASGWYIWHVKDLQTGKTEIGKFAIIQ